MKKQLYGGGPTLFGLPLNPNALRIVDKVFDRPLANPAFENLKLGAYTTRKGLCGHRVDHAIVYRGDIAKASDEPVLMRIDSGCMTSAVFHDESCDCHWQLLEAMKRINDLPQGRRGLVVHHFHHEGKAHGYTRKLKSYRDGMYPVPGDLRRFESTILILKDLGVRRVIVMTNNPEKMSVLTDNGIEIVDVVNLVTPDPKLRSFLLYKQETFGHHMNLTGGEQ